MPQCPIVGDATAQQDALSGTDRDLLDAACCDAGNEPGANHLHDATVA